MKAAVFGNEKVYEQTLETAKLWGDVEAGNAELPKPKPLLPEERKRKFKEIVMAYKHMNAHPRAWAIIDNYKDEFDDPEELKREIQDDWLELTDMLCGTDSARRVMLYGYELLRVEVTADGTRTETRLHKPLDVKIPWIYPEGWREAAQQMLDDEMKKLGMFNEQPRTGHAQDSKVSPEAKSFRETTIQAKKIWSEVCPRQFAWESRNLRASWADLLVPMKNLESYQQIGDNGTVNLVLATCVGKHSFQAGKIIDAYEKRLTISNVIECLEGMQHSLMAMGYHWVSNETKICG